MTAIKCDHTAPLKYVRIDAPSARLSLRRLVPTRASVRFTELRHGTTTSIEHRSHALENPGGLGAGPQVRCRSRKGIRKSVSESVLTKSNTVADPFDDYGNRVWTVRLSHAAEESIDERRNQLGIPLRCDVQTVRIADIELQ